MEEAPWQIAKKWHLTNGGDLPFELLLAAFLDQGYLWSSPTEFVLAKRMRVDAKRRRLVSGEPNCYFVHLAAGRDPFLRFLEVAPGPLPYVCWTRAGKKKLHCYTWDQFEKRIAKKGKNNGN